jgi:hypothetical protein
VHQIVGQPPYAAFQETVHVQYPELHARCLKPRFIAGEPQALCLITRVQWMEPAIIEDEFQAANALLSP